MIEWVKDLTDRLLLAFLWRTSQFGSQLTKDGKLDQMKWRERRLRNLRPLRIGSVEDEEAEE